MFPFDTFGPDAAEQEEQRRRLAAYNQQHGTKHVANGLAHESEVDYTPVNQQRSPTRVTPTSWDTEAGKTYTQGWDGKNVQTGGPGMPTAPAPAAAPANQENNDFLTRISSYLAGTTQTPAQQQYMQGAERAQDAISSQVLSNQAGQNIGNLEAQAARAQSALGTTQDQGMQVLRAGEMPGLVAALAGGSANAGAAALGNQQLDLGNAVNAQGDVYDSITQTLNNSASQQSGTAEAENIRLKQLQDEYALAVAQYGQNSAQAKQILSIIFTIAGTATAGPVGGAMGSYAGSQL